MDENTISVGDFLDPRPDDSLFPTMDDAMRFANDQSQKDEHRAVAVWRGYHLERVFLRGYELSPV